MFFVRIERRGFAVRAQCFTSSKTLKAKRAREWILAKYIRDTLHYKPEIRELTQIDEGLSIYIRPVAFIDKIETLFLFPSAKNAGITIHSSWIPPSAICYHEELLLPMDTSEIAICAKPTYRCQVPFGISQAAMHITQCFLDTEAGLSLVYKTLIP